MIEIILTGILLFITAGVVLWMCGAIYLDMAHGTWMGWLWVLAWLSFVVAVFWWSAAWWISCLIVLVAFGVFLRWWLMLEPSHDRAWDPNFDRLARVDIEGDQITVGNVRNTEYRSMGQFEARYETRTFFFSQLRRVDVLILYWGSTYMSHPMFVFDFGPGGRLCISIEVRYRVGQRYSFWRSLYRQQELMYVVSDERDAILRRTKFLQGHDLYLYQIFGTPLEMRQFFLEYATQINRLVEWPRWYHGITANCTTGIYMQGRGRMRWDWAMLFNGQLDQMLYDRRRLDTRVPFEQLKRLSWVNDVANRAPRDGFGDFMRRELPGYLDPHVAVDAAQLT